MIWTEFDIDSFNPIGGSRLENYELKEIFKLGGTLLDLAT